MRATYMLPYLVGSWPSGQALLPQVAVASHVDDGGAGLRPQGVVLTQGCLAEHFGWQLQCPSHRRQHAPIRVLHGQLIGGDCSENLREQIPTPDLMQRVQTPGLMEECCCGRLHAPSRVLGRVEERLVAPRRIRAAAAASFLLLLLIVASLSGSSHEAEAGVLVRLAGQTGKDSCALNGVHTA